MIDKIKQWIVDHPYFLTSAVFLAILFVGWRVLYWREENFAFILLLYFIVTLGIRLDDISRKIGTRTSTPTHNPENEASLMHQLNDIKHALLAMNATLNRILEKNEKKDP
jgi:cytochrome b561